MRFPASEPAQGIYLLAATVASPLTCEPVRDALRALLLGRSRRLHWTHEASSRQLVIAETIATQSVVHTVVIGAPLDRHRQERARRLCMERLFFELEHVDVSSIWIESRHESLNRQDQRMVDALRNRRALSPSTVVGFARPGDEPMLWVPDAVAGAVGGARTAGDPRSRELLGASVTEIEITLG